MSSHADIRAELNNKAPMYTYGVEALQNGVSALAPGTLHFVYRDTTIKTDLVCGVEWDYSSSSMYLTRTGDASSFVNPAPASSLLQEGKSPFDYIMPWAGMKRYNIINSTVMYSEDDDEFDATNYDTVVYIPQFYYKAEKDTSNSKWRWSISAVARDGFALHPGSGRYVGRYHTCEVDGAHKSVSGVDFIGELTPDAYRVNAITKGNGWYQIDYATICAIFILYIVEYANWNSQSYLGVGSDSQRLPNGVTDGAKYHTLRISNSSNQYRWIENLWSNARQWVDGFIAVNQSVYLCTDPNLYSNTTTNYTSSGVTLPSSGSITGFGYSTNFPWAFIPDKNGGADNTYVCDTVNSASGTMLLYTGGNSDNNTSYGLFYHGAHHDASYANWDVGSRLMFVPGSTGGGASVAVPTSANGTIEEGTNTISLTDASAGSYTLKYEDADGNPLNTFANIGRIEV